MSTNVDIENLGLEIPNRVSFNQTTQSRRRKLNNTDYSQPEAMPERNSDDGGNVRAALRLRLSIAIKRAIEARGLTQVDTAFMARTPRTSLTAIVNGNLDRVSMDRLITIAHRLGVGISLRLTTPIQSNPLKS